MARAYSHDLRVRVLDAVGPSLSRRAAALRYWVGIATVIRWAAHATMSATTFALGMMSNPDAEPSSKRSAIRTAILLASQQRRDHSLYLAELGIVLKVGAVCCGAV